MNLKYVPKKSMLNNILLAYVLNQLMLEFKIGVLLQRLFQVISLVIKPSQMIAMKINAERKVTMLITKCCLKGQFKCQICD